MVLACARRIVRYDGAVRHGDWRLATGMPMFRVRGRVLGIVGFGKIGQTVARKATALGLLCIAFDPYVADAVFREHGVEATSLDELLARADFVTLHVPLTGETRHMFDAERLADLKPTAFLVNTSRGGVIDQDTLVAALRQGQLAGAALDVFEPERLADGHPLLALPNVIATPHVAFYSEESVRDLALLGARNVAAILAGRRPASLVNPEVLALPRWAHLQPALAPSARLG